MLLTMLTSIFPFIKQYRKTKPEIKGNTIMWLFLMSSAVSVFYWGKNMSTITAPNVGYTGAINASSNAVLTILSAFIFKEELKPIKFLYVIGVVIGIIILII